MILCVHRSVELLMWRVIFQTAFLGHALLLLSLLAYRRWLFQSFLSLLTAQFCSYPAQLPCRNGFWLAITLILSHISWSHAHQALFLFYWWPLFSFPFLFFILSFLYRSILQVAFLFRTWSFPLLLLFNVYILTKVFLWHCFSCSLIFLFFSLLSPSIAAIFMTEWQVSWAVQSLSFWVTLHLFWALAFFLSANFLF